MEETPDKDTGGEAHVGPSPAGSHEAHARQRDDADLAMPIETKASTQSIMTGILYIAAGISAVAGGF